MTTDGIMQGLGSMSGLLIIISIITVGMIMAIRNKKAKFKEGRNKPKPETKKYLKSVYILLIIIAAVGTILVLFL